MSIRITALCIVVVGLAICAWKDWFKSLCGLILLMYSMNGPVLSGILLDAGRAIANVMLVRLMGDVRSWTP